MHAGGPVRRERGGSSPRLYSSNQGTGHSPATMYELRCHNATGIPEKHPEPSLYPATGNQQWGGGPNDAGAMFSYHEQERTPSAPSQPKVIRRDHEQTSPRLPYGQQNYQASTPPRVRIAPPVTNNPAGNAQTGLTPMAAQLHLGGNEFSSGTELHSGYQPVANDWSQRTPAVSQEQQQWTTVLPQYHPYQQQYSYQQTQTVPTTGYSPGPLGSGISNLQPAIPGTAVPTGAATGVNSLGPHSSWLPYTQATQAQPQQQPTAALQPVALPSSYRQLPVSGGSHSQGTVSDEKVAAAAGSSLRSVDPSWPYLPGFAVVEGPTNPPMVETQPPQQQVVQRHIPAQPPPTAVVAPAVPTGIQHSYSLRSMAAGKAPASGTGATATTADSIATSPGASTSPVTPLPQQTQAQERPSGWRCGISPTTALRTMGHLLTTYEKQEVFEYQQVWFVGRTSTQKIRVSMRNGLPNGGFDDTRGDYNAIPGDHLAYRFEILGSLGRGSFGQVLKCLDHATGRTIALKIIRSKSRFQRQARIEASILSTLAAADPEDKAGIVRIIESFTFRSHLCITFELLGANLYEHIKHGGFAGLPIGVVRKVALQVLNTLVFLKGFNIVHCDLKPENILLVTRGSYSVKVIDFGSSCYADQRIFTYIQSRFYRAPEVILGMSYGPPIDMWSLACVIAELCTGTPLFPGEDEVDQMAYMQEVLNLPPRHIIGQAPRAKLFFDPTTGQNLPVKPYSQGRVHRAPGTMMLSAAMRNKADTLFLDFIKKCLQWDPEKRLTPEQALKHPWIAAEAAGSAPGRSYGPLEGAAAALGFRR